MKKPLAIVAFLLLIGSSAQAQKVSTWKGGTPGRNTDWNCATNWKENCVPNEFSSVIIPDVSTSTFSFPVIKEGTVEVFSLQCAPSARLTTLGNSSILVLSDALADKPVQGKEARVYAANSPRVETFSDH